MQLIHIDQPAHPKAGRKPAMTPYVVDRLLQAFRSGYSNKSACSFAGISQDTFYSYIKQYPEFSEEITDAKAYLRVLAATTVARAIVSGDIRVCQWYLERKEPKEFGKKKQVANLMK